MATCHPLRHPAIWLGPLVVVLVAATAFDACAQPPRRGGGGGRRPGGPGGGRAPAAGGVRPGAGNNPGPGRPGNVVPGPAAGNPRPERIDGGRPADRARTIEGRPATGSRDVESFLDAKPGGPDAAARKAIDPDTAKARAESMQASLEGRTQPFTPAWYAEHPGAWQYTHPHAEWWAVAGAVSLTRWLGYPVQGGVAVPASGTAATTGTAPEDAAAPSSAADEATDATPTSDGDAADDAPPSDLEWLPLGVYAVAPAGAAHTQIVQQLAVNRGGEIRGNSYDAISNATQPISGSIDRTTRSATWTVGKPGGAVFETTLDVLMKSPGGVRVKSGRAVQEWEMVRMEKPGDGDAAP